MTYDTPSFCFQNPAAKRNGNFEHFVIFCE